MARRRLRPRVAAPLLLAVWGCAPVEVATVRRPLDGSDSAPQRLVESRAIAWPPARHGNRFVSGWLPPRRGEQRLLVPREGVARLEWIRLADGPRRLDLDLELGGAVEGTVQVSVAGRALGDFPVGDPLRLPMPADLPRGKIPVELVFRGARERRSGGVVAAALTPAAAAGEIVRTENGWRQSGWSALDFYLRVRRGEALVARFEPPVEARPQQRFELVVERQEGDALGGFRWQPTRWNRWQGERSIRVPLGEYRGLLRVRLLASGEGPPATWHELALLERTPPAAAASAPSSHRLPRVLLLYVLDALRADHVGHLGGAPESTPTLDRLAAEGISFHEHRSVAPNTLPATKALLTGELPRIDAGARLPRDGPPTLAEKLRAVGYRTALITGNPYVGPEFGTDRGFEESIYVEPSRNAGREPGKINDHAARVHAAALAWLSKLRPDEPAFLYLHVLNPHNPYAPPAGYLTPAASNGPTIDGSTATLMAIRQGRRRVTAPEIERLRELYRASVAYADAELGRFLSELGAGARTPEFLLAVTADHGEELFDHGGVLHGYTLYDEQLRIPLVLWSPGRFPPRRVHAATHTLDLHRTLLELGGARPEPGAAGADLSSIEQAPEHEERVQLAAAASLRGGILAARSARFKLIWAPRTGRQWGMGEGLGRSRDPEYLFALDDDPHERRNRAGELHFEAEYLRGVLDVWLAANDLRRVAAPDERPPDAEALEQLRALGYL